MLCEWKEQLPSGRYDYMICYETNCVENIRNLVKSEDIQCTYDRVETLMTIDKDMINRVKFGSKV